MTENTKNRELIMCASAINMQLTSGQSRQANLKKGLIYTSSLSHRPPGLLAPKQRGPTRAGYVGYRRYSPFVWQQPPWPIPTAALHTRSNDAICIFASPGQHYRKPAQGKSTAQPLQRPAER